MTWAYYSSHSDSTSQGTLPHIVLWHRYFMLCLALLLTQFLGGQHTAEDIYSIQKALFDRTISSDQLDSICSQKSEATSLYLQAYDVFLEVIIEDQHAKTSILEQLSEGLQKIKNDPIGEALVLALQAENKLHQAICEILNGHNISAVRQLSQAQKKYQKSLDIDPTGYLAQRGDATLKVSVAGLPDGLEKLVVTLTSLSGDIEAGYSSLVTLSEAPHSLRGETLSLLTLLVPTREQKIEVLESLEDYYCNNPHSAGSALFLVDGLLKTQQASQAQAVIADLDKSTYIPRFQYFEGLTNLYEGRPDKAIEHFGAFAQKNNQAIFYNDALLKMQWCHILNSNLPGSSTFSLNSDPVGDADKVALYELTSDIVHHPQILQGRLRMDGGYPEEALRILRDIPLAERKLHHEEWLYRLGRVLHVNGQYAEAEQAYSELVNQYAESNAYYKMSAALHWSTLLLHDGRDELACQQLKFVLSSKSDRYERNLHQKARILQKKNCF